MVVSLGSKSELLSRSSSASRPFSIASMADAALVTPPPRRSASPADELMWVMVPVIKVSRLCGVAPYSLTTVSRSAGGQGKRTPFPATTVKLSQGWLTYCCLVVFGVFFVNVYTFSKYKDVHAHDARGNPRRVPPTVEFVSNCELFFFIFTSMAKCGLCLRDARGLLRLLTALGSVSTRNAVFSAARLRRRTILVTAVALSLGVSLFVLEYSRELYAKGTTPWSAFIILATGVGHALNAVFAITIDVNYTTWLLLLDKCFLQLNFHLEAVLEAQAASQAAADHFRTPMKGVTVVGPRLYSVFAADAAASQEVRLKELRLTGMRVISMARMVDEGYRNSVLLSAIYVFFITMNAVYFLTEAALGEARNVAWLVANVICAVVFTVLFMYMVLQCQAVVAEAGRTPDLVHDLLNKEVSPQAKEELKLFSMQLLHRKVSFTAGGVFEMDYSLLFKLIGGVTTYMVVLLQIQPQLDQR